MIIKVKHRGNFKNTERFFEGVKSKKAFRILESYGKLGCEVLSANTPIDSGVTANSWDYKILQTRYGYSLQWTNSNTNDGIPIVILLQYGHGTRSGGYVEGRDFINPAIRPVMDALSEKVWTEVAKI